VHHHHYNPITDSDLGGLMHMRRAHHHYYDLMRDAVVKNDEMRDAIVKDLMRDAVVKN